jgi:hypothetical protein
MPRLVSTSGRPSSLPTPLPADLPVSVVYSEAGSTAPLLLFCLLQRGAAFHRRSVQGQQGETAGRERQTTRGKVVIIDAGGQTLRMFAEVIYALTHPESGRPVGLIRILVLLFNNRWKVDRGSQTYPRLASNSGEPTRCEPCKIRKIPVRPIIIQRHRVAT